MQMADGLSKGQNYTRIFLNVFKSPSRRVVMTSFDNYNVGRQAYQQMCWMINLDGVGIWSQSGIVFGVECVNICGPAVVQKDNVLLVVYNM
jgi:hypothetical protein